MTEQAQHIARRCAIYTRKSTNARLESDVNSLTMQREISSAYIKSQQYKGWVELSEEYNDGGHSGSGLERPALARLMKDVEAGHIDVVVVYKIDRLTRSLLDFVRLMDIFERGNISLISVSQAFDTSDSMGRMILNILLTFSQFERELISERVRDSIRTRKRHGKVHGGKPPFGYVYTPDGLEVDQHEARIVEFIFAEFLRTRRYVAVMNSVREAGFCSSVKMLKSGKKRGGTLITPGTVYNIIRNPIYVGEIRGHTTNYQGRHDPIISRDVWQAAQELSRQRTRRPPDARRTNHFLAGILWDEWGRQMRLDLHWTGSTRYAFYVSANTLWSQLQFVRAYRAKAEELDRLVKAALSDLLCNRKMLRKALRSIVGNDRELDQLCVLGRESNERLRDTPPAEQVSVFQALLARVEVAEESVLLRVRAMELERFINWDNKSSFRGREADWHLTSAYFEYEIAVRAIAAERWPSLHIEPRKENQNAEPDAKLIDLIRCGRQAQKLVDTNRDCSIEKLAGMLQCRPAFFARLIRINYLAPDIVTAILDGTHPPTLTRDALLASTIPTDWAVQRQLFGFEPPRRTINPANLYGRGLWHSSPPSTSVETSSR